SRILYRRSKMRLAVLVVRARSADRSPGPCPACSLPFNASLCRAAELAYDWFGWLGGFRCFARTRYRRSGRNFVGINLGFANKCHPLFHGQFGSTNIAE